MKYLPIAVLVLLLSFFKSCKNNEIYQSKVNSRSMAPTIKADESVLWEEVPKDYNFNRGDIVIIEAPAGDGFWLRRIIGLEKEVINIKSKGIDVNNQFIPWLELTNQASNHSEKQIPSLEIPKGHLYLIGDNLEIARDSREFGPISKNTVIGKVIAK